MLLRFIHVVAYVYNLFFLIQNNIPLPEMYWNLLIHFIHLFIQMLISIWFNPAFIHLRLNGFYKLLLEKAMAPHSSTLAWKIPWMEKPGGLQSMGSLRVGHDWATFLSLFTFMHGRRKWQPTPVFLPGESQGQWSLVGCRLWGRTESDMTEVT